VKLFNFILNKPKRALAITLFVFLALLPGILLVSFDFSVQLWFKKGDPFLESFDKFSKTFGTEDYVFLALSHKENILTNDGLEKIRILRNELNKVEEIEKFYSIANFTDIIHTPEGVDTPPLIESERTYTLEELEHIKNYALHHPLIPGLLLSKNAESVHFLIYLKKSKEAGNSQRSAIRKIDRIAENATKNSDGYSHQMVGTAAVTEVLRDICELDLVKVLTLLLAIMAFLCWLIFKSIWSIVFVFSILAVSVISAISISGYLGIAMNNLSSMVPGVLMAIAIADSIHFMISVSKSSGTMEERCLSSLKKNFVPTLLTSLTTAIGFFGLTFSDLVPIKIFGALSCVGTLLAWFYSIFLLFPLLIILKNRVNLGSQGGGFHYDFGRLAPWIQKNRYQILAISFLMSVTSLYFSSLVKVNSNPFNYFDPNVKIYKDNQYFNKMYGGFSNFEMSFDSGKPDGIYDPQFLKRVDTLHEWIKSNYPVNYINSLSTYVKRLNQSFSDGTLAEYRIPEDKDKIAQMLVYYFSSLPPDVDFKNMLSVDYRYMRSSLFWSIQDSNRIIKITKEVENKAKDLGLEMSITGREFLFNGMNDYVVSSFIRSICFTVFALTLLFIFLFKSIPLGLLSAIPNVVPVILGGSLLFLWGKSIDIGTAVVASVCFGIAVDDTIHFLYSLRRHQNLGLNTEDLVRTVLHETGLALVTTTVLLTLGFLSFLLAEFQPNYNFAILTAVVLSLALLADLILLPALLIVASKKDSSVGPDSN